MKKRYFISPFILQIFLRTLFRPLILFFLRPEIKGLQNLKKVEGNVILASNHISELDAVIIPSAIPLPFFFKPFFFVSLSKKYYEHKGWRAKLFYGGTLFKLLGGYEAYKGKRNYAFSLQNHLKILRNGGSVYIFPEGRATLDGTIGPAKGGLGFLLAESALPVIPIAIKGIFKMSPKDFLFRRRKLRIKILEPVKRNNLFQEKGKVSPEEAKEVSQKILDKITGVFSEI